MGIRQLASAAPRRATTKAFRWPEVGATTTMTSLASRVMTSLRTRVLGSLRAAGESFTTTLISDWAASRQRRVGPLGEVRDRILTFFALRDPASFSYIAW